MRFLAFQPAFDVLHTQFRFLRLRRLMSADTPLHFDQLRIADFYLVFFFRLADVRLSPRHKRLKQLANSLASDRYEIQPDDHLLFSRMGRTQRAAVETLSFCGFFDSDAYRSGVILEGNRQESSALASRIDLANESEAKKMAAIQTLISEYDLLGPDGIKARTGLLEHRYDAI